MCLFLFQWLSSVVSLQTSIAKFLAQRQMQQSSDSNKTQDSVKTDKTDKPTASVQPVVQNASASQLWAQDSTLSNGQLLIGTDGKAVMLESDRTTPCASGSSQDTLVNGPLDVSKGAVSLLYPNTLTTVNGDLEMDTAKSKPEAAVMKTRSNSLDSAQSNVVKVTWPSTCSEKQSVGSPTSPVSSMPPSSSRTSGQNLVISALNKPNNTLSKLPLGSTPGGKVLQTSNKTNKSIGSSATSILPQRMTIQQTAKATANTSGNTSSAKIITVSAPPSGKFAEQ